MNKLNHAAFIMDGNGRWGLKRNKGRNFGHFNGVRTVQRVVEQSIKLKIPILTFYVFSTENWKRPKSEIIFLFNLIKSYFIKELKNVMEKGIRIKILGTKKNLSSSIKTILAETEKKTKNNKKILVNLAINYGSRNEISNTLKTLIKSKKITERLINQNLYTQNLPDPDILVRTGGKKRLSNFMLWQLAYTELYFIDKLWPDFNSNDLIKIVKNYKKIDRNYGSI